MSRFIWEKENLLALAGKKELFKFLILTNLSPSFIIAFSITLDRLIHGLKGNFRAIVNNTNGLMIEMENG